MGFDVTYHPFAPSEVCTRYFDHFEDKDAYARLAQEWGLDENRKVMLQAFLAMGREFVEGKSLQQGHAYHIAMVSGLLRKYWYLRSCRFSRLLEFPEFSRYVIEWRELVPDGRHRENLIPDRGIRYRCGVFLSPQGLKQLRADYDRDEVVHSGMNRVFPRAWLGIFWKAVDYAIEREMGLIEAIDLDAPNPSGSGGSYGLLPLEHRDVEGVELYKEESLARVKVLCRWREKRRRVRKRVGARMRTQELPEGVRGTSRIDPAR